MMSLTAVISPFRHGLILHRVDLMVIARPDLAGVAGGGTDSGSCLLE